jgi:hypothetical protein
VVDNAGIAQPPCQVAVEVSAAPTLPFSTRRPTAHRRPYRVRPR